MSESSTIAKSFAAAHPTRTATTLAFTAGFVDTLGFILLGGVFTAHVTGNFVLIGATLATSPEGVIAKLSTLPAFFAAVVLVTAFATSAAKTSGSRTLALILGLEALFLAAFLALGIIGHPFTNLDGPMTVLTAMTGAAAMGLQNAAARLHLSQLPPSTMMTGNVTQIGIDIVDVALGRTPPDGHAQVLTRLARMSWTVLSFALGALLGATAAIKIGFWGLVLAIAITAALTVFIALSEPAQLPTPNPKAT